jgi:hypothetical protein
MSRWICKACTRWGARYASVLSFGFAPNFSDGRRTSHWSDWRPAPRCDERTEP